MQLSENIAMMKIHIYNDPGHGWFAIKTAKLIELGIADQITQWSYQRGATSYLEEDCDASLLIRTLQIKGIAYEYVSHHTDKRSPIRSYPSYKPPQTA